MFSAQLSLSVMSKHRDQWLRKYSARASAFISKQRTDWDSVYAPGNMAGSQRRLIPPAGTCSNCLVLQLLIMILQPAACNPNREIWVLNRAETHTIVCCSCIPRPPAVWWAGLQGQVLNMQVKELFSAQACQKLDQKSKSQTG